MPDAGHDMDSLVSTEWLSRHLDDPDLVVLECTVVSEPQADGGVHFDRAALLNGGQNAWIAEGRSLSTETVARPAARLTPRVRPRLIADRDEVLAAIDDDAVRLIDTLPAEFYRGEATIYARSGHIPGAINICALDLLDESGHYRPQQELAAIHDGDRGTRAVSYCGGGIMASSSAFVMTRLGFTDVAVYTASLQEWAADPANPLDVDTD